MEIEQIVSKRYAYKFVNIQQFEYVRSQQLEYVEIALKMILCLLKVLLYDYIFCIVKCRNIDWQLTNEKTNWEL